MQRLGWAGGAVITVLLIAACSQPVSTRAPSGELTGTAAAKDAEWQQVLAAAKHEGIVSLASTQDAAKREAMLQFQKAYPEIRVDYLSLSFAEYETRVKPERAAGIYSSDVFSSGTGSSVFQEQIPSGWYDPLKPALYLQDVLDDGSWLGGFDGGFLDDGKQYVYGFGLSAQNYTMANRDIVSEDALNTYQDLLKPEFKGKIVILDATRSSAGSTTLAAIRLALGDDRMRQLLVDQQPINTADRRQIAEWLVRGTYPIGIGITDSLLQPFRDEGLGKNVRPIAGALPVPAGSGQGTLILPSKAPHPNAAKVFVNWLLSHAGQTEWSSRSRENSRRLDVPPSNPGATIDQSHADRYINLGTEENQAKV